MNLNAMLLGLLLAASCTHVPNRQELVQSIDAAVSAGEGARVSLPEMTDFAWDEICIANPNARGPVLSRQLGFKWRGSGTGVSNEQQLLIFVESREPRSASKASGELYVRGDKWLIDAAGCLPRDSAVFAAQNRGGVYALVPVSRLAGSPAVPSDSVVLPGTQANQATSRILFPLDSFPQLPPAVRKSMADAGCLIPQSYVPETPNNVVSGQFAAAGQTDWAVLCSRRDTSSIFIVWGGPVQCPSPIRPFANAYYGAPRTYGRFIAPASMDYILQHQEMYDGPEPPARDHEGLHDGITEKASTVYFCHRGKWYELQGAD